MKIRLFILLLILFPHKSTEAQEDNLSEILKPGAELVKLAGEFSFTEGPAADKAGNVYFTDQPNDRICKWSVDGKLTTFLQPCGRSNGLFFDKEGTLYACADANNELWKIDPKGNVTILVKDYKGKKLNGPNLKKGTSKMDLANQVMADIKAFKESVERHGRL